MNAHQRRVSMTRRHRAWPRGTPVLVNVRGMDPRIDTDLPDDARRQLIAGAHLLHGRVDRHLRGRDHVCDIEFAHPIDLGDANGLRFCHLFNFRRLKPATTP